MTSEIELAPNSAGRRKGVRVGFLVLALTLGLGSVLILVAGGAGAAVWLVPGDLDPTFGNGGIATFDLSTFPDILLDGEVAPDGKIVAVGARSDSPVTPRAAVIRTNSDGSLDTSFGISGTTVITIGLFNDIAFATKVMTDGRIIVAGTVEQDSLFSRMFVARLESDGDLDPTFSPGTMIPGVLSTTVGSYSGGHDVVIQPDGKIVVAGVSNNPGTGNDFAVLRLNVDGTLDTTFGSSGIVTTGITSGDDTAYAAQMQQDGKILVGGRSNDGTLNNVVALARYNSDGSLDAGFGVSGIVTTPIGSASQALGVTIQPDGKIVLGGTSLADPNIGGLNHMLAQRYNSDGSLDTSFANSGTYTIALGASDTFGTDITIDQNGKILLAGVSSESNPAASEFTVLRLTSTGLPDLSWGNGGVVTTEIGANMDDASWVDVQSDGKVLVGGAGFNAIFSDAVMAIVRYLDVGSEFDQKIYLPAILKN